MGKITDYWLEQLKPVTDLSKVRDLSMVRGNGLKDDALMLKPDETEFFISHGYDTSIIRYKQAKESYGLECNACTVMYLLQSYGLIPNMTREEFEHAFTPLVPKKFSKNDFIYILGQKQNLRPIDLFSDIFGKDVIDVGLGNVTRTENILRGANGIASPVTPNGDAVGSLNKIVDAFLNARKKGYSFSSLKPSIKPKSNFKSLFKVASEGNLTERYFKDGGTIYTGVSLVYNSAILGHYVLVVRDAISFLEANGKKYYIYPVDDSWHGRANVLIPNPFIDNISVDYWIKKYRNISENSGTLYYKNQLLFTIVSSFAIGQ